jgi:riboflavin biosynthesis pyrimidine reductase
MIEPAAEGAQASEKNQPAQMLAEYQELEAKWSSFEDQVRTQDPKGYVDLEAALDTLWQLGMRRVLVEGGATLNFELLRLRLVDELQLFIVPVVVGGGTSTLPDRMRLTLELLDERRFTSGVVYLRYRATGTSIA